MYVRCENIFYLKFSGKYSVMHQFPSILTKCD